MFKNFLEEKSNLTKILRNNSKSIELFLVTIGILLKKIRIKKRKTIRKFCIENNLDILEIHNIEKGIKVASPDILKCYLDLI